VRDLFWVEGVVLGREGSVLGRSCCTGDRGEIDL